MKNFDSPPFPGRQPDVSNLDRDKGLWLPILEFYFRAVEEAGKTAMDANKAAWQEHQESHDAWLYKFSSIKTKVENDQIKDIGPDEMQQFKDESEKLISSYHSILDTAPRA